MFSEPVQRKSKENIVSPLGPVVRPDRQVSQRPLTQPSHGSGVLCIRFTRFLCHPTGYRPSNSYRSYIARFAFLSLVQNITAGHQEEETACSDRDTRMSKIEDFDVAVKEPCSAPALEKTAFGKR